MSFVSNLRSEFSFIRGNYAILLASWIIVDFAGELPTAYFSLYVLGLNATETILGVIGFSQFLALASLQFPGGYLADKHGRKWLISTMTFGVALSFIVYAIAPSWPILLVGVVLMSIFNSTYQPAMSALISDSLPPERRGMGFSIIMLIAGASTTPSPAIAALLNAQFGLMNGMRIVYIVVVILFLIAAFFRFFFLKETVTSASKPKLKEIFSSYPTALKESVQALKQVPRSLIYLFLSFSVILTGFSMVQLLTAIYATKILLINQVLWGLLLASIPITTIALALPIGKLVDKVDRRIPLLLSMAAFGLAIWLFVYGDLARVIVTLILYGAAQVMLNASFSAIQTDLTPKMLRGKVNGFMNFAIMIVMAVGSFIGGFLYDHVSPQTPFLIAAATAAPSVLLILLLVRKIEKREE